MFKKIIEDKRILSLYIIVICVLVIGVTYALGTYSMGLNITTGLIAVDASAYGKTSFDTSKIDFRPIIEDINANDNIPEDNLENNLDNIIKIEFTVGGASTNNNDNIIYDIALADLQIHCNLISSYIKWKLVKDGTDLSSGSLDKGIKDNRLVLTEEQFDLPDYNASKTGYHNYTFYMWMSDSCQSSNIKQCIDNENDQTNLMGKYFSGRLEVELYTEGKGVTKYRGASETTNCLTENPNRLNNEPNLDNGNLIPVYYHDTGTYTDSNGKTITGVWKKADSDNTNNSWYDYSSKKWANAVIIGDSTRKKYYQKASAGTIINDADITAFYVWIPRFKYRVWNITRQGGDENTYAYPAFTKGIDIKFEMGTNSTGNVECTYNVNTTASASNLSDTCIYNKTDTITVNSGNANYTDAWYTHPAFTFGDKEIEGFWIGKFETSTDTSSTCYATASADNCNNTNQNPRILPDVSSLRYQNISNQFTTARKFQSYLSDINAHMLTNLEWGAVAYLTHSIYGLCTDDNGTVTCAGVNQNNSEGYFTGRSGGNIAGNISTEKVFYSNDSLTNNQYNTNGYYNYKGYKLDSSGNIDTEVEKNITKVASTTKNVTGVYDMSGGAYEYVMGNMVNSSGAFYPSSAVSSGVANPWNESSSLDSFYYNAYSYGTNYYNAIAFNRARLGDATAEVLGGTSSTSSWKVGSGITGSYSIVVYSSRSWFIRGNSDNTSSGAFDFFTYTGASVSISSFRSSLS